MGWHWLNPISYHLTLIILRSCRSVAWNWRSTELKRIRVIQDALKMFDTSGIPFILLDIACLVLGMSVNLFLSKPAPSCCFLLKAARYIIRQASRYYQLWSYRDFTQRCSMRLIPDVLDSVEYAFRHAGWIWITKEIKIYDYVIDMI